MSKLKYLVIHCTATPEGREVTPADIKQWHIVERGWSRVGYSDLIQLDGMCINLHPYNEDAYVEGWEVTNGAKGYNGKSRHVVYSGGLTKDLKQAKDTRTVCQKETLEAYVKNVVKLHPNIKVIGHNQIANKACPSFDVPEWLESIGITSKNIGL